MSFIPPSPPPSSIWDTTGNDPSTIPGFSGDPSQVDGIAAPVQVGGTGNTFESSAAAPGQTNQVVLSGENNILGVGTGNQNIQTIGGGNIVESQQILLPDGSKIISVGTLGGAPSDSSNGATVNEGVIVNANFIGETATIDQMSGSLGGPFQGYAHGGTGDDILYGSAEADFLRGGQGNDQIFAYGGNDVVRGGDGSDLVSLGTGDDYLYYTQDQLLGGDTDTVTDFNDFGGTDLLAFDASAVGGANFTNFGGFGTNTLSVFSNGATTNIVASNGYLWKTTDIAFVV